MKTTNNAQKTENRNFGKSMFRTLIAAGLVIFTFAANASDSGMQLQEKSQTENVEFLAFAGNEIIASRSFFIETSKENKLEVENWMTNEKLFSNDAFYGQTAQEETLEMESWMIENPYFEVPEIRVDFESAMEIESWMLTNPLWTK